MGGGAVACRDDGTGRPSIASEGAIEERGEGGSEEQTSAWSKLTESNTPLTAPSFRDPQNASSHKVVYYERKTDGWSRRRRTPVNT